ARRRGLALDRALPFAHLILDFLHPLLGALLEPATAILHLVAQVVPALLGVVAKLPRPAPQLTPGALPRLRRKEESQSRAQDGTEQDPLRPGPTVGLDDRHLFLVTTPHDTPPLWSFSRVRIIL